MNNTIKNPRSPTGTKKPDGRIKLAVKFKPELFQQIKDRATRDKKHFSETLNDILECGLLDLWDLERDEVQNQAEILITHTTFNI